MKKILLISAVLATASMADMMTDMATDAAMSKAKTQVRETAVKHVAGNDATKKEMVNKVADEVLGKEDPMDKLKSDALSSVTGSKTAVPDVAGIVGGKTKETSITDKATDMAVEKAVGSNPLKKAAATEALKSVM